MPPEATEAGELQARAESLIDGFLALLDEAGAAGVEIDPLAIILDRLAHRGETLDMSEAPPMLRMLLGGMGG
jgi:hypothetical protein